MVTPPTHPQIKTSNSKHLPISYFRFILLTVFFFLLVIFSFQGIEADVISLNSGGSTNLSVGVDKYVEGFFFGGVCGDGIIDSGIGEQCDDGNTDGGDGCSSTCQTEVAPPSGGGGGAGGGGGGVSANIFVTPTVFNINLAINTNTERTIRVTNLGASQIVVGVSQQNLSNMVILGNNSLIIPAGAAVELNVIFVASDETGIFTGKILIGGKEVLVVLNVQTELLLFDSNIVVLNDNSAVPQGEELKTLVTLIPLGDPSRLDVTLNFIVKDFRNKVYLTKSETLLVNRQVELVRNFDTGTLPLGDYVIGLELVYPNGVAPSSAYFKVTQPAATGIFGKIVLFLIILILLILILIIILLILRRRRKKKEEERGNA